MRAEESTPHSPPSVILLGPGGQSEGEERRAQDKTMHDGSAEPEMNLDANKIGTEQDTSKTSEDPEQTETQQQKNQQ